jgi:3-oxoadipate enol-lactonase
MPTVKVGDINSYYEIHGEGESLLMLAGHGQHSGQWTTMVPEYSKKYRAIIFDCRGTGRSDKPDMAYTMRMMADDARGLLDAVGVDAAHVFGVSMGGMIAQEFALNYPDRVISLILGCTTCGGTKTIPPSAEARAFFTGPEMARISAEEGARRVAPWLWSQKFLDRHPEVMEQHVALTLQYPTPSHGHAGQSKAMARHDTYDRLPGIKAPTLVISGGADRIVPVENSRLLASRIPHAELVILENAGHGFTVDAADEASRIILDFLERHARSRKKV